MESHRFAYKNIFLFLSSVLSILFSPCAFAGETLITTTQEYYTESYTSFTSQSGNNVFEEADGTLHAVFVDNYELYYLQSTDSGATWTKENLAADHNGDVRNAALTVDHDGYVFIGFTCNDYYNYANPSGISSGSEFYGDLYCMSNKSGAWTEETVYTSVSNYGARAMAMVVDGDNNIHLFANRYGWYTYGGTAWEWVRDSTSDTWGSQTTVATITDSSDNMIFYDYYRSLVDSIGTITLIMSRYNSSTKGEDDYLFYVQYDGTWSGINNIDQPNRDYAAITQFDAAIDGSDHIYLVYVKDLTAGTPQVLLSTDFGAATAIYTGESGELIYDLKLHSDAAGQLTLFIRRTDGSGSLVPTAMMTRPVGGLWSSLEDIDTAAPDGDVFTLSVVHTDTLSSVFNEAKLTYLDRESESSDPYGAGNFYFNDLITSGWNATTSLPVNRMLSVAAAPGNGYVYIMNGYTDSNSWDYGTADGRSFYAPQNSNGSLGEWTEVSATIPSNLMRAAAGVTDYNGYIYIAGGAIDSPSWDGNIWYTQPGSMGDITEWTQASNSIGEWIGSWPYMEAYNGYLYVGGGRNAFASPAITTRFYYAPINSDGSPGTWTQTTDLPEETIKGQLLFYNERAHLISGDSTNVYYADITDGAIGAWTATTSVPATVSLPSAHVIENRIYLAQGGSTTFYYSEIQADGTLGEWVEEVAFSEAVNPFEQGTYYNGYYYLLGDQSDDTNLTRVLYHQISTDTETDNDPPSAPTAVSPGDESVVASESVSLTASAFDDPDSGDSHAASYWMVRRADSVYGRSDYDESFNLEATSDDLTSHEVAGLFSGMKYIWKVGYVDSGSETVTWSEEYSFKVGESVSEAMPEIEEGTDMADFRMMSFPYWLDDPSALSVYDVSYDTRYYRIGHYEADTNDGEYIEIDDLDLEINPGEALWVLSREGMDLLADGIPVSDAYDIEVPLRYNATSGDGWNQIGCPNEKAYAWGDMEVIEYSEGGEVLFGPTPISELEEANEYVDIRIWEWADGGYDPYTPEDEFIMYPYEGYWVKTESANIHLVFPVSAQLAAAREIDTGFAQAFNRGKEWVKDMIFATHLAVADSGDSPPMPMGAFTDSNESSASQGGCFIATAAYGSPYPVILSVLFVVLLGIIGRMLLNRSKK